ncbi:hypothetical protein GWI33_010183 [Rhynchophorus ferrugineus]|uniref:Uncharacterized protein n=1 Tax=Rhynchophorus ferrugineus TaxID=354439 RepID=A0A834MJ22_RHYFE|nr:hypothetical protein GWI33_010183 [Rhynchophorus ferrugineus]
MTNDGSLYYAEELRALSLFHSMSSGIGSKFYFCSRSDAIPINDAAFDLADFGNSLRASEPIGSDFFLFETVRIRSGPSVCAGRDKSESFPGLSDFFDGLATPDLNAVCSVESSTKIV